MQISPTSPVATSLPSSSRIEISVDGSGRPIVPVNSVAADLVGGGDGRGFRQAVAFGDAVAGQLLPAFGDRALHRHAAAERQDQRLEVELAEVLVVQQRVEQRVEARKDVEPVFLQFLDEARNVARIGDEDVVRALLHAHQRVHRQREDVIERQRANDRRGSPASASPCRRPRPTARSARRWRARCGAAASRPWRRRSCRRYIAGTPRRRRPTLAGWSVLSAPSFSAAGNLTWPGSDHAGTSFFTRRTTKFTSSPLTPSMSPMVATTTCLTGVLAMHRLQRARRNSRG